MSRNPATPLEVLRHYWGYDAFRPLQEDIIESVLRGDDTLGLLPTGGGKSLTFQVPAMLLDGLTLVVTPLISLMKDQVDNLAERGIRARFLHAGMTLRENNLALDSCRYGHSRLLYVSPEKLQSARFIGELEYLDVAMIVVDEAHCISQWGYDFRPSYLRIGELRRRFPAAPVLALTASATPEVADDIMTRLGFARRNVFARSFARDNLSYIVRYDENKQGRTIDILKRTSGSAIVYVRSRRRTREIAEMLVRAGIPADYYHAGLGVADKNERQNRWKDDRTRVMVATNAFGMGIDKPDVRTVIHYDLPSSLEEYYQEAGRAGRDGKPSFAVVVASKSDKATLSRRLAESFPDKDFIRYLYEMAGNFLNVAVGEGYGHMYEFDFDLFCSRFGFKPSLARNALMLLTRSGYVEFVDEISTRARLMMVARKDELYNLKVSADADAVLQTVLRLYTGVFADYVAVDEGMIARQAGIQESAVYPAMLELGREHVLHFIPRRRTPYLLYPTSRELPRYLEFPKGVYEDQRERMAARIEAMKRFVFDSDAECRVRSMLEYFGEKNPGVCGRCDLCREARRTSPRQLLPDDAGERIVAALAVPMTIETLESLGILQRESLIEVLRRLIAAGRVSYDPVGKLFSAC